MRGFKFFQEVEGKFGPRVETHLFTAPNLMIRASKSGKLDALLVGEFLDEIIKPNSSSDTLYILDNWSGQTKTELYKDMGSDSGSFMVKFVPEQCTDLAQ